MSSYEQHKAQAAVLLARTNEKVRKDRFNRDKARQAAKHVPWSWNEYYWLFQSGLMFLIILHMVGLLDSLLYHNTQLIRVSGLLLVGAVLLLVGVDYLFREFSHIVAYEVPEQCTTESEPSDDSSGTPSPSESGQPPRSTPWQSSWEAGTASPKA